MGIKRALVNLKISNKLVDIGRLKLWQFKMGRKLFAKAGDASSMSAFREAFGLPKETTGRLGKITLESIKKQRKFAAFALRELQGKHFRPKGVLKGGYAPSIKGLHLGGGTLRKDAAAGGKFSSIAKDLADKYAEGSKALGDRLVNARGRGVRFVRIKGRIVPIRGKK